MDNKLAKIIVSDTIRSLLTSGITFWATKHAIGTEIAQKLAKGDTVSLWQGTVPLSIPLITSVLAGLALPILFPIAQGIFSRINEAYKLMVARASSFAMTKQEVRDKAAEATIVEKITAVATETPPAA